tara:strand:+ start:47 stop:295 length:249 start_codon:yes stop_codon:yes gene_type:complete
MKKIKIGTLVRLKFKTVRYSQYQLVSEKIEQDKDKPVGIVIRHGYKGMDGPLVVEWIKGNCEIGHPAGSIDYFDNYKVEVIA